MRLPEGWKVIKEERQRDGLKVTLSIPSKDIERWENEGGSLTFRPFIEGLAPFVEQGKGHSWRYDGLSVRCIFCHTTKGSPTALLPCTERL